MVLRGKRLIASRIGGLLTDKASWRWCFYVNIPFGVATAIIIAIFFKDPKQKKVTKTGKMNQIKRMDPFGIMCFIPAIISILLGLQWGGTKYSWTNARIIMLFVLFGVFCSLWCFIQYSRQDEATVPPRLLCNRNVLGAVIHATFLGGSFFVFGYYVSTNKPIPNDKISYYNSFQYGFKPSKRCLRLNLALITCRW